MAATYPHLNIDVYPVASTTTVTTEAAPLHLPVVFLLCEKGPVGVPTAGDGGTLPYVFGSGTFDNTKAFYNHATLFAQEAMDTNQIYVVRVADSAAASANLVLQVTMTPGSITQYQKDSTGALILDANGNKQAKKDASGNAITEPGYTATWSVRALASTETYDGLTKTVTGTEASPTSITYPILGFQAKYVGSAASRYGFRLWYSTSVDSTEESSVSSFLYRFQPIYLSDDNSGNVNTVSDIYSALHNDVSFKSSAVDASTAQDISLNGILSNNYPSTGNGSLDYDVHVYSDNVTAIGTLLSTAAPTEFPTTLDPFMINIIAGEDANGNPYDHLVVDEASEELLNSTNAIYLQGGSDGDTSVSNFETLVTEFIQGDDNTEFQDQFRYPFTHFYDSGFALANKYDLLDMLSLRDGIYLQMTTFDASATTPNTQAQDQSSGASLLARLRTYPESTNYGTGTCRASIDVQAGKLAVTSGYTDGWVPTNLDVLSKNCTYYSGTYVKGTPKGRPNNVVTLFSSLSWTTATATQKQLNWDTGLNVISYADYQTLFYADRRTIYNDDTALLSDETFMHYIVFIKKIARTIWTYYVGREESVSQLSTNISNDIDSEINRVFGSRLSSTTTVTQTDADKLNGFSYTVTVALVGNMPDRIWNVIIPCTRSSDVSSSTSAS